MARRSDSQPTLEDWWSDPTTTASAPAHSAQRRNGGATTQNTPQVEPQPSLLDEARYSPDARRGESSGRVGDTAVTGDNGAATPVTPTAKTTPPRAAAEGAHSTGMATTTAPSFAVTGDAIMAPSGPKARIEANLEALRALRVITEEGRPATPHEQGLLA